MAFAFSQYGSEVVGPDGGQRGDYGGRRLAILGRRPSTFVSIASPYHRTNRFYAIDVFGRLWLSVDAGRHWTRLRASGLPETALAVAAVRGDITLPDVIYVASGDGGLWRSRNDGATFRHVADIPDAHAIALTTDDQRLVLVAGDRLYLSTERPYVSAGARPAGGRGRLRPRNRRLAYATVGDTLLRSVDRGQTWP